MSNVPVASRQNVVFSYGEVISLKDLPDNSIALDGAVEGPGIDAINRRYSFDHHGQVERFATLATCQQVRLAQQLGLVVDADTAIYINDVDADTSMSAWLLLNPTRWNEQKVIDLVNAIGNVDAHGPSAFEVHDLHHAITPKYNSEDNKSFDYFTSSIEKITNYLDGSYIPEKGHKNQTEGWGYNPINGWFSMSCENGFSSLYGEGAIMGFIYNERPDGTHSYTVGSKSDFVNVRIGPSHKGPRDVLTSINAESLLGQLGLAEIEKNSDQSLSTNWGGGSTVGGSPRNEGGSESQLSPEEVLETFKAFLI